MTQWGLDTLFNPGKRHMDDEKRRLQSTREEIGDSSGGRRIDLESGRATITVKRSATEVEVDEVDDDTELAPALEAEDVPAVALASGEAEIEPEVADDAPAADLEPEPVAAQPEPVAAKPEPVAAKPEPVADDVPIEAPTPEPVPAAAPKKRLSAGDWSRRG